MQARPRPRSASPPGPSADHCGLPRRSITAALIGFPALWTGLARAQAPAARRLTPAQTEGPYYPVAPPADSDNDLLRSGALQPYGAGEASAVEGTVRDRKSTRLNSSHSQISYAVFCLKK